MASSRVSSECQMLFIVLLAVILSVLLSMLLVSGAEGAVKDLSSDVSASHRRASPTNADHDHWGPLDLRPLVSSELKRLKRKAQNEAFAKSQQAGDHSQSPKDIVAAALKRAEATEAAVEANENKVRAEAQSALASERQEEQKLKAELLSSESKHSTGAASGDTNASSGDDDDDDDDDDDVEQKRRKDQPQRSHFRVHDSVPAGHKLLGAPTSTETDSVLPQAQDALDMLNKRREASKMSPLSLSKVVSSKVQVVNGRLFILCLRMLDGSGEVDGRIKYLQPPGRSSAKLVGVDPASLTDVSVAANRDRQAPFNCSRPAV